MATREMAGPDLRERRAALAAHRLGQGTAIGIAAAPYLYLTPACLGNAPGVAQFRAMRKGCQQRQRIRMGRFEEQALAGRELHDLAGVENRAAVAEVGSDADIARDEQQGAAMTGGKTAQQ